MKPLPSVPMTLAGAAVGAAGRGHSCGFRRSGTERLTTTWTRRGYSGTTASRSTNPRHDTCHDFPADARGSPGRGLPRACRNPSMSARDSWVMWSGTSTIGHGARVTRSERAKRYSTMCKRLRPAVWMSWLIIVRIYRSMQLRNSRKRASLRRNAVAQVSLSRNL